MDPAVRQRHLQRRQRGSSAGQLYQGDSPLRRPSSASRGSRPSLRTDANPPAYNAGSVTASPVRTSTSGKPDEYLEVIALPPEQRDTNHRLNDLLQGEGVEATFTPTKGPSRFASESRSVEDPVGPSPPRRVSNRQASQNSLDAVPEHGEPSPPRSSPAAAAQTESSDNPLEFNDLYDFVSKPAPEGIVVQCEITRDKHGVDRGMYPAYYLKLERPGRQGKIEKVFLLAGRKRKKSKSSNYLISIDPTDLARDGDAFVAKLRSNFVGTSFTLYDDGVNPGKAQKRENIGKPIRKELAGVLYDTNVLGFKGPRKMTVVIPGMNEEQMPYEVQPQHERDTILERHKLGRMTDLLELKNKKPSWSEETLSYVLNFKGRVTQASVKNFQIVHKEDPEYVILQFGRITDNVFTMDFQYPMTAIQAFGICLSSFDSKLACE